MLRRQIASIDRERQDNTILLTLVDRMADQKFNLRQVMATAHKPAFIPRDKRDHFKLDPEPSVFGDLYPNYHGLLFLDTGLEKPDLPSFLDKVPEEVSGGILHHMEEVHTRNMERVRLLDNVVQELYSILTGLVNDGMEVIRGYGKLATALLRKCGSFVRPASIQKNSTKASKPPGGKLPSNAVSSAAGAAKKKRSKGSGRKAQGLPPHIMPPPFKPQPARISTPAPERPKVVFTYTDPRPKYHQATQRQQQRYEPGKIEIPRSPP